MEHPESPDSKNSIDPEEVEKQVHSAIERIRSRFRQEMTEAEGIIAESDRPEHDLAEHDSSS